MIAKIPLGQILKLGSHRLLVRSVILSILLQIFAVPALAQNCEKNEYDVTKCVKQAASYDLTRVFMFSEVKGTIFEFNNSCSENLRVIASFNSLETKSVQLSAKTKPQEPEDNDQGMSSSSNRIVCEVGDSCKKIRWIACSSREAKLPDLEKKTVSSTESQKPIPITKEPNRVEKADVPEFIKSDVVSTPQTQGKDNVATARSTFVVRQNWDITGQDLRSLSGVSADECKEACRLDGQCVGFTLDRWNRYCFLKSGVSALRLEPKASSGWREGIKPPTQSTSERVIEPYRKRRFSGSVLDTKTIEGASLCQSTCSESEQCLGFSFISNSRQCWRFSQIENHYPDDGVVSGAKRQEPSP